MGLGIGSGTLVIEGPCRERRAEAAGAEGGNLAEETRRRASSAV